jgi:hypothetical protein
MIGTTISFDLRESLLLYFGTSLPPANGEWASWVEALKTRAHAPEGARLIVVAGDGGPSVVQRKQLIEAVKTGKLKTAVVSDSLVARGIVTAFKWYGLDLEAFTSSAIEGAYRFVSASADEAKWLRETLKTLERSMQRPRATAT